MLFRVCEHYDDNYTIVEEQINDCFICFEYKIDNENRPISLQTQKLYFNNCVCDGAIHNCCLKIWIDKNNSCPICRVNIIESNNTTIIFYNYIPFGIRIYMYIQSMSIRFFRFFTFILFLYAIIDFYLIIINTKYTTYNDYTTTSNFVDVNQYIEYQNKSN